MTWSGGAKGIVIAITETEGPDMQCIVLRFRNALCIISSLSHLFLISGSAVVSLRSYCCFLEQYGKPSLLAPPLAC